MAADTVVPLCTVAQLSEGAFADLVRSYRGPALPDIMIEATRACETECGRRLAPFTTTESHRAEGIDPDEFSADSNMPLDLLGTVGQSYAANLGSTTLVRHLWLNDYAPLYPELWTYSNIGITVLRSYGGSEVLPSVNPQYIGPEPDTGHIRFNLGKYIPIGSWLRVTYSGGYTTIPADLVRACKYMAAAVVARELDPLVQNHGHSADELESLAVSWLGPYVRS